MWCTWGHGVAVRRIPHSVEIPHVGSYEHVGPRWSSTSWIGSRVHRAWVPGAPPGASLRHQCLWSRCAQAFAKVLSAFERR